LKRNAGNTKNEGTKLGIISIEDAILFSIQTQNIIRDVIQPPASLLMRLERLQTVQVQIAFAPV